MQVLSVNVGGPREIATPGGEVRTSIYKLPIAGRVEIRNHNLAGDDQSDRSVHGGVSKAIYAYPHEHYGFWQEQLPHQDLQPGYFGENLTITGLLERDAHVGDRLRIGSADLVITQPRMPCFKLAIRVGHPDIVKRFLASRRPGFYLAVAVEGNIAAGDAIEVLERHPAAVSIPELLAMYLNESVDRARLEETLAIPALSQAWRADLQKRLDTLS